MEASVAASDDRERWEANVAQMGRKLEAVSVETSAVAQAAVFHIEIRTNVAHKISVEFKRIGRGCFSKHVH